MVGLGGLNSVLVDPVLQQISNATANIGTPLNIALIVIYLAIGIGLAVVKDEQVRPFLIASIVVIALACWPRSQTLSTARARIARELRETEESETTQHA